MILNRADQVPPFVCRMIARKQNGWKPLSHSDIAKASGIPRSTVAELSVKTTWGGVTMAVAASFSSACGVDLGKPERYRKWLRESAMIHAKNCTITQQKFFLRLFKAGHGSLTAVKK